MRLLLIFGLLLPVSAQPKLMASFADPNRPGTVRIDVLNGAVTVIGGDQKEVIVEGGEEAKQEGNLRRVWPSGNVTIDEGRDNVIRISAGLQKSRDFTVRVPKTSSVYVRSNNSGPVRVEGVDGEIDATAMNGPVQLEGVGGPVIAHALNGRVTAVLSKPPADKPMAFTSLNGSVDVTMPADTKATFRLKSDNGEMYTDFEMTLEPGTRRTGSAVMGKVNGGGPEIRLETMNGKIFLRKK